MEAREAKRKKWLEIICESRASGRSIRTWCKENGVTYGSYYYWFGVLRDEGLVAPMNGYGDGQRSIETAPVIAEVHFAEETPTNKEEIPLIPQVMIMRNSYQVYIGKDFDDSTLRRVLEVVGQC